MYGNNFSSLTPVEARLGRTWDLLSETWTKKKKKALNTHTPQSPHARLQQHWQKHQRLDVLKHVLQQHWQNGGTSDYSFFVLQPLTFFSPTSVSLLWLSPNYTWLLLSHSIHSSSSMHALLSFFPPPLLFLSTTLFPYFSQALLISAEPSLDGEQPFYIIT